MGIEYFEWWMPATTIKILLDAYPLWHHRRWAKQKISSFILILSYDCVIFAFHRRDLFVKNIIASSHWLHLNNYTKRVTLVYLYHVNRCRHYKKLSIAKLDFIQVCGLSLNFYNKSLRKFYKFSDSRETWISPTLQSADLPISRQYYWAQVRKRVSYPEVY